MKRVLVFGFLLLAACQRADVRAVVYYDFVQLEASPVGEHYQEFVDLNGGVVSLGCFVVELRQTNCFDVGANGSPNLHLGVVECECPCTAAVADPCGAASEPVTAGTIRGVVDELSGPLTLGGVEIPVDIDLAPATRLFITREPDTDSDPLPSGDIVLEGELRDGGAVLRGELTNPGNEPVSGRVTIVPVQDEVSL
jgi:hypothetical protein